MFLTDSIVQIHFIFNKCNHDENKFLSHICSVNQKYTWYIFWFKISFFYLSLGKLVHLSFTIEKTCFPICFQDLNFCKRSFPIFSIYLYSLPRLILSLKKFTKLFFFFCLYISIKKPDQLKSSSGHLFNSEDSSRIYHLVNQIRGAARFKLYTFNQ